MRCKNKFYLWKENAKKTKTEDDSDVMNKKTKLIDTKSIKIAVNQSNVVMNFFFYKKPSL